MQTKLTLRLEERLVKKAKKHAKRSGRSVSQLVADYFALLGKKATRRSGLTPNVKTLKGALKGSKLDTTDYRRYLEKKHP